MRITALILFSLCSAQAADKWTWIRRATVSAACVASAFDAATTRHLSETNPILSRQGNPAWGRIISLKIGVCAGSIYMQEKVKADKTFTGVNIGTAAVFTAAGIHNKKLE